MAHPLAARLEEIVKRSRSKRVSLAERLQVVADLVRTEAPEFCAEVDNFVGRLEAGTSGHVCDRQLAYSVPAQHVFVMNDQRAYDSDSRTWGSFPCKSALRRP